MVIVAICSFFASVLSFFVGLMPNMKINFTPEFQDSFVSILNGVNALVPVNQMFIILGLIVLVYTVEFLWLLLNWIIAKIPFID